MIFNRTTKIKGLCPYMKKIDINIPIRDAIYSQDIILIPDGNIYDNDLFYESYIR